MWTEHKIIKLDASLLTAQVTCTWPGNHCET
jgi:hypothetical protein